MGGRGKAGGALCHHELSSSLMVPSARSQALPLVSLYASREFARGSANGTAAIFPFYSAKAGNPLPPLHSPLCLLLFMISEQLQLRSSWPSYRAGQRSDGRLVWEPTQTLKLAPLGSSNLPAVNCDRKRSLRRCAEGVEIKNRFAGTAQSRIVSPSTGAGGMKTTSDSWVSLSPTHSRRSSGSAGTPNQQMRLCVERGASRKKKKSRK